MCTYRCMSCSWHTVHFMQLSLTIFEIPGVYISYNFPLTQSEFHTLVNWNISCVHFNVVIETYFYSIACQGMVDLTKTTFIRIPHPHQPKLDPLKTMKNEERNNYHHAQMQKCILLKYLKEVWHRYGIHVHVYTVKIRQTRYTYHLFAAWIGGICWPKGFAYIYLYPKYRLPINPRQREREINLCAMSSIIPCLCLKPHLLEKLYWQALGGFLESIYVNRILCRSPLYHISSIH